MKNSELAVGLVFANSFIFRKSLRQFSIVRGFELKFEKNERKGVTASCKNKCGWRIHASLQGKSTTFQVKTIKGEPHRCPRGFRNKSANSTYLAEQYLEHFLEDPSMSIKSFRKLMRKEVKVYAHRQKLYRAKQKAIEKAHGNVYEQYSRVRQYCHEILKTNPGSTAVVKVQGPPIYKDPRFQRIFVFFDAMKRGFIEVCRPIIGLDACFLKTPYGGQLIAVIARDGNNQMFHLAIAVVESECRESWTWFLNMLIHYVTGFDLTSCNFIYDRQKGLVETFQSIMPNTDHRFCVRHLYANFKLKFKDKALKDLMWSAARAYLEEEFNKKIDEIKDLSNEAYVWLKKIPTNLWCKHAISARPKCDLLNNNLCESFNSYIKEARELPILTMMEALRRQFMCRIQSKRQWIEKCTTKICPRIQDKLNSIKDKALEFECHMANEGLWEVTLGNKGWVVDFRKKSCSCKEWDMTGIPCTHATCALMSEHKDIEDYVSPYFSVDNYKKSYSYTLTHLPDHSQWSIPSTQAESLPILPPPFKKQTGRPRKMRKRGYDEISVGGTVTRQGTVQTFSNCGDITHNKRRCKKPPSQKSRSAERPNNVERPRKRTKAPSSSVSATTSTPHHTRTTVAGQSSTPIQSSTLTGPSTQSSTPAGPSTQPVRGQGSKRHGQKNKKPSKKSGPHAGIGNWNGVGMFRPPMQVFFSHHK
ncbi:PREDICTED: uncharacterized protein LOC105969659 [Erythranthe guttata]|uniref:uncharacterized protein LOC105969659 n=1 Tax=Erythranthe guttata TaxID=4155 RepID=UPI00064E06FE|nr:PREDICTED: uncharacterized protein LOC105969659 [Erythranthe guttata]|eukprot:XP_012849887.1 PREDICTED: uncharacterized protein LOC105969659 [Erythranthe guttata]